MSRTRFFRTKRRRDGKQQYRSFVFPTFEEASDDIIIEISEYTRLDVLADQFFDDASLWWVIAAYNNLGAASLFVEGQTFLRIPNDIQIVFSKIKELN